tara:strand:+ start:3114 stop:6044 length:2931 start_codon:yes stop_codon:yes gene_type:complete
MKKFLTLLFLFPLFAIAQTCDVDLIGFDIETNQISVAILNGENCGCNEYTQQDGNTCEGSTSSVINNNESITHLVFGIHIYEDYTAGPCSQANYHPGWTFAYPPNQVALTPETGYQTGDTINFSLITFNDWDCLLGQNFDEECLEMAVWQINLGQTANIEDFPTEYWTDTCGTCADQTHMYPDIDLSNNTLVWCPGELPPPPLYPGCTDEEANNYNPNATFDDGSCEYPPILGCTSPTACNYNAEVTEDDGSCAFCYTEYGDSICNAYHNSDGYWDYYVNLFNCEVDIEIDSTWFIASGCDLLDAGLCQPQLRFHTDYTNIGDIPIYSWQFDMWSGDWFSLSAEYGVNYAGGNNIYSVPLPSGESGNTLQSFVFSGLEWEEGDTLWIQAKVIEQTETNLSNNIAYFILPEFPICEFGCTDSLATNYNPNATCDSENCEYLPITDLAVDSITWQVGCDTFGPYWNPTLYFTNNGEVPITEYCIKFQVLGQSNDTVCFTNNTILPGEIFVQSWPNVYDWGTLSLHLLHINGESENEWYEWGSDNNVANNMFTAVVNNEPTCGCTDINAVNYNPNATEDDGSCTYTILGCTDIEANNYNPDATEDDGSCTYDTTALLYIDTECDLNCNDTLAWYNAIIYFENIGNTIITDFCIEWDIIGFNQEFIECFEGELLPGEDITMEISPITSDGTGGVIIRLETLNGEEVDVTWFQPTSCYQQALATCIYGCTDPNASNYNPAAEWDDGSCEYNIYGCTDDTALNYNPDANVDDGSCIYDIPGCTDPSANNYNPLATINDGSCTYDILGCTDPNALNYNPAANVDDGSCEYPIPGCTDPAAINYNPLATVDDGSCTYLAGCTDPEALNYNSLAILDDGSCVYPPEDCDGSYFAPNTFTPNNDGLNDGWAVLVADPDCWRTWNVQIFNRWGGLVWESNDLNEVWQGNVFDNNYYVSDGVYVYKVIGTGWDPSITFKTTGSITIFR